MTPTHLELWLARHGQTTANEDGVISGWHDVELTPAGARQARALGARLAGVEIDRVWSSDLARAVATARIARGEPELDPRLREIHFGDIEGARWDTLDERFREALLDFERFAAPGGEDLLALSARLLDFVGSLEPGRHLVVTHGGVIRMLTRDLGEDRFVPNAGLVVVDWTAREILEVWEP